MTIHTNACISNDINMSLLLARMLCYDVEVLNVSMTWYTHLMLYVIHYIDKFVLSNQDSLNNLSMKSFNITYVSAISHKCNKIC